MLRRMRIATNPELCRDCQVCTLACSLWHEGSCGPSLARLQVTKDMARYTFDIRICQHCASPECIEACPAGAMSVDDRGVVIIHDDECTLCGACATICPYDAIIHHEAADRYFKCDLCSGRERGPLCVELCPVGALSLAEVATTSAEDV